MPSYKIHLENNNHWARNKFMISKDIITLLILKELCILFSFACTADVGARMDLAKDTKEQVSQKQKK